MIQFQYRIPKGMVPTPEQIEAWRASWIAGKTVPGVRIRVRDWRGGQNPEGIRRKLSKGWQSRVAGIVEHYAEPNVTMCDYDLPKCNPDRRIWAFARMLGVKPLVICYRRTARGWHVVIHWDRNFSPAETVAIQAILGSDAFRETYNLVRVLSGHTRDKRWNLLFRRKIR